MELSRHYEDRLNDVLDGITEHEFAEWANHPLTKALVLKLQLENQNVMEMWAAGNFTHEEAFGTIQLNSKALGKAEVCIEIREWLDELREALQGEESDS